GDPGNVRHWSVLDGERRTRQLWSGLSRNRPASGTPGGQDPQGDEAGGDPRGGEPEGRTRHQSESRESSGAYDRAGGVVSGRSDHPPTLPDHREENRDEVLAKGVNSGCA